MKEAGLIIDFYLPSVSDENTVKEAVSDFFAPFIRLLKSLKDVTVSLNIPLSTLELLDNFGYQDLIQEIKELYEKEKIELIGFSPYRSSFTGLNKDTILKETALNEYALGYYLGSRQGFEGEPSIMIKDLDGFLSPDLKLTEDMIQILNEMGYKWVAVDSTYLNKTESSESEPFVRAGKTDLVLVGITVEIEDFSVVKTIKDSEDVNIISEKEDFVEFKNALVKKFANLFDNKNISPTFKIGSCDNLVDNKNKYKKLMDFQNVLFDYLTENRIGIKKVGELIKLKSQDCKEMEINKIEKNTQKLLQEQTSDLDKKIFPIMTKIEKTMEQDIENNSEFEESEENVTSKLWKNNDIKGDLSANLQVNTRKFTLFSKYLCLDKYKYVNEFTSENYKSDLKSNMLGRFIYYAREYSDICNDKITKESILKSINEITAASII